MLFPLRPYSTEYSGQHDALSSCGCPRIQFPAKAQRVCKHELQLAVDFFPVLPLPVECATKTATALGTAGAVKHAATGRRLRNVSIRRCQIIAYLAREGERLEKRGNECNVNPQCAQQQRHWGIAKLHGTDVHVRYQGRVTPGSCSRALDYLPVANFTGLPGLTKQKQRVRTRSSLNRMRCR